MKSLKKALLVVDLSPGWESAVETAIGLVEKLGTEVVPIHVIPCAVETVLDSGELRKALDARLREIVGKVTSADTKLSDTLIAVGISFDEVVRRADDENVNVIIVGAGVTSGNEPVRTGPLATRVMRHARKPVWIVKPGAPARPRSILCPVDTSPSSERALRNAIRLAAGLGARLTVLHVIRTLSSRHSAVALMEQRDAWDQDFAEQRKQEFQEFLLDFDFGSASWRTEVCEGEPRREIVAAALSGDHDLIVMGTVGRTALTRLLVGSVTERVTQALPCSVVTLKDESLIYARISDDIEDCWQLHRRGRELLDDGQAGEAAAAFERAVAINRFLVPAWEGLADAQEALGHEERARRSRSLARRVSDKLWKQMVELGEVQP